MKSLLTPQLPGIPAIGPVDFSRMVRLREIENFVNGNAESVTLRWPTQSDALDNELSGNRRDLGTTAVPAENRLLLLPQQLAAHSAILRAGANAITVPGPITEMELPTIDRSLKASWGGAAADVAPTLDLVGSTPHRLSAFITISRQLMQQAPMLAASFIEAQLLSAVAAALDDAALNGDGDEKPFGLLADTAITEHEILGGSIAWADVLAMEAAVATAHGEDPAAMVWLADIATRTALRGERSAGLPIPVWTDGPNGGPIGQRGIASPWAPADTLVHGNAATLLVIQSNELRISRSTTKTDAIAGKLTVDVTGWFDIVATDPAAFVRAVPAA